MRAGTGVFAAESPQCLGHCLVHNKATQIFIKHVNIFAILATLRIK